MQAGTRLLKQILIAAITLVVVGSAAWGIVRSVKPPVATPTPDPRATLAPVEVLSNDLFAIASHDYDFLARVKNPNPQYGSSRVAYELVLHGRDGHVVATIPGSFYILPGQIKYVLVTPIRITTEALDATMRITGVEWEKVDELALRGVSFVSTNTQFLSGSQPITARVRGLVLNNSDFDIAQVDVVVVLFDANDRPYAANRTEIRTFISKTTRGFETAWISPVSPPTRVLVEAQANVFHNETFIRIYGTHEKFQQLY